MYADGRIEWTTGDWSGGRNGLSGTEALAGINAGDQTNHITIPGSQTPGILNVTRTSNIDIPGMWMFKVGGGMYVYVVHTYGCLYMYIYVCTYVIHTMQLCTYIK